MASSSTSVLFYCTIAIMQMCYQVQHLLHHQRLRPRDGIWPECRNIRCKHKVPQEFLTWISVYVEWLLTRRCWKNMPIKAVALDKQQWLSHTRPLNDLWTIVVFRTEHMFNIKVSFYICLVNTNSISNAHIKFLTRFIMGEYFWQKFGKFIEVKCVILDILNTRSSTQLFNQNQTHTV